MEKQLPVMLHEIFHVFSRYNEPVRDELYAMIGFKKSDKKVVLSDALKKILLTNPDGVSLNYIIKLDDGALLEPAGLGEEFKRDGLKVWVQYAASRRVSLCENSMPITISEIKKKS